MKNKNKDITNTPIVNAEESTVKTNKKGFIKNVNASKKGAFSAILIAIFCVALILVNALSIIVAQKYPTYLDLTGTNAYKLTKDNIKYIEQYNNLKEIKKIEIIVCATKAGYTGSEMVNYAANLGISENNTSDNYFNQTIRLIEEYPKFCSKISVDYVDPQEPSFEKLESETDVTVNYGDIIVRASKDDGSTKTTHLGLIDLYEIQSASDYYGTETGYTITINNTENAISGALNKVAMGVNKTAALITKNCNVSSVATLQTNLDSYDYTISEYKGTITYNKLKDFDAVIIAAPTNDFDNESLKMLDKYLENGGKLGKTLIYFASQSSPKMPNLNMFLQEWGIKQNQGVLYETNTDNHFYEAPTSLEQVVAESDYTKNFEETEKAFYSSSNVPFKTTFSSKGTRTVTTLLETNDSTIVAPKGTSTGYTVSSDTKTNAYPTVILSVDARYDDDTKEVSSAVIAFSSEDFVNEIWTQYTSVANMDFAVQMINTATGRENSLYIMPKGTNVTGIANPASATVKTALLFIFVLILPILTIVGGILIWTRRIKK